MFHNLWRLGQQLTLFKTSLTFILISGLMTSVLQAQFAVLLKKIMDSLSHPQMESMYLLAAQTLGLVTVLSGVRYWHIFVTDYTVERFIAHLRLQLQKKWLTEPPDFFLKDQSGSGTALSRILNDMNTVQGGLRYLVDLIREPVTFILLLGWLFYLNWKLSLSIILILPILYKLLIKLYRSVNKYSKMGQEKLEGITQVFKENLDGSRIIQAYNLEDYVLKKLNDKLKEYLQFRKKVFARIDLSSPISEWIGMIVGLSVILFIAFEIAQGRATYGDFTSYVGTLLLLNKPIKTFQDASVRLQEVEVAASRYFEWIDRVPAIRDVGNIPFPSSIFSIEFHRVSYRIGDRWILKDVSFQVGLGQQVALVGPSGAGKSTILNLLCRFIEPTHGFILINGIDIRNFSLKDLRKHIALVTQDTFLFDESLEKNVQLGNPERSSEEIGCLINELGLASAGMDAQARKISSVGERGGFLSGGERQRLGIARALFRDAPILLFDEATSQLDSENEDKVYALLRKYSSSKITLLVAHRLSSITFCDRILVFQQGELVQEGDHLSLVKRGGLYLDLVNRFKIL
ncbi:MAG: ABC transporter ATP-binding protein/permease [Bdellovibrionaceae bacterium]|nr:ABC transporter ATP-binding protein/permease [Pseudobdellovibrionaceae bacterium]MDW8190872.1 ABC transporter ATP-binding protein [Pseudobdellovibrionaceae bacterium]